MASKKSAPKAKKTQTQAQRLLEVAKKAKTEGGNPFARASGKTSLASSPVIR